MWKAEFTDRKTDEESRSCRRFPKTIVNVILFCAIVVAAGLLVPPFAGITTVMVDDVDMQTNLPQGIRSLCGGEGSRN